MLAPDASLLLREAPNPESATPALTPHGQPLNPVDLATLARPVGPAPGDQPQEHHGPVPSHQHPAEPPILLPPKEQRLLAHQPKIPPDHPVADPRLLDDSVAEVRVLVVGALLAVLHVLGGQGHQVRIGGQDCAQGEGASRCCHRV